MTAMMKPVELERSAITLEFREIAGYLQRTLGTKLVAYIAGLRDTKSVSAWIRGEKPRDLSEMRLRSAYHAARMLVDAYGEETTKSWFVGSNHLLDDQAPAYVLREAKFPGDLRFIIPAARAFTESAS